MVVSVVATVLQYKWELVAALIVGYVVATAVYRRFFHPLAKIPGPFLPAVTMFYQTAYNGRYYMQVAKLHEKYGPVVRITPNEVHLNDPDDYDKIYHVGSKYGKSANYYNALCVPASTFGTISNDLHRIRRGALNPVFSRKMVLELEAVVQDKAAKVCQLVEQAVGERKPVDLHHAFRSVSVDVISDFAFNKSYDFLGKDDLGAYFFRMVRGVGPAMWVFQQFPTLQALALKMPPWLAPILSEPLGKVFGMQAECVRQVEDVKSRMEKGQYNVDSERPTIFSALLTDDEQKPDGYVVPTTMELKDEAYSVLAAAADTTGNAMTVAAFNVVRNADIYAKLVAELENAFPDAHAELPFQQLERLPYLTAVIKEGLRLSFGVIGRLPRVVPDPGATFNGYFLPAGTIVGMSSWQMHRNPDVFPNPMKFDPSRWLDPEDYRRLDHHMVPFGRGSSMCVGMPLAYCELYVTLASLFRRFPHLEVYQTRPEDMDYDDFFSSYHVEGKKWFKAVGKQGEKSEKV